MELDSENNLDFQQAGSARRNVDNMRQYRLLVHHNFCNKPYYSPDITS